ncbi:MAG: hypothetical protein M1829_004059 [Trizodia sp. TS-e1964]|nr:MAG: hypothetical protein M1829_004059 [Trizodia sp. TS-e1964]
MFGMNVNLSWKEDQDSLTVGQKRQEKLAQEKLAQKGKQASQPDKHSLSEKQFQLDKQSIAEKQSLLESKKQQKKELKAELKALKKSLKQSKTGSSDQVSVTSLETTLSSGTVRKIIAQQPPLPPTPFESVIVHHDNNMTTKSPIGGFASGMGEPQLSYLNQDIRKRPDDSLDNDDDDDDIGLVGGDDDPSSRLGSSEIALFPSPALMDVTIVSERVLIETQQLGPGSRVTRETNIKVTAEQPFVRAASGDKQSSANSSPSLSDRTTPAHDISSPTYEAETGDSHGALLPNSSILPAQASGNLAGSTLGKVLSQEYPPVRTPERMINALSPKSNWTPPLSWGGPDVCINRENKESPDPNYKPIKPVGWPAAADSDKPPPVKWNGPEMTKLQIEDPSLYPWEGGMPPKNMGDYDPEYLKHAYGMHKDLSEASLARMQKQSSAKGEAGLPEPYAGEMKVAMPRKPAVAELEKAIKFNKEFKPRPIPYRRDFTRDAEIPTSPPTKTHLTRIIPLEPPPKSPFRKLAASWGQPENKRDANLGLEAQQTQPRSLDSSKMTGYSEQRANLPAGNRDFTGERHPVLGRNEASKTPSPSWDVRSKAVETRGAPPPIPPQSRRRARIFPPAQSGPNNIKAEDREALVKEQLQRQHERRVQKQREESNGSPLRGYGISDMYLPTECMPIEQDDDIVNVISAGATEKAFSAQNISEPKVLEHSLNGGPRGRSAKEQISAFNLREQALAKKVAGIKLEKIPVEQRSISNLREPSLIKQELKSKLAKAPLEQQRSVIGLRERALTNQDMDKDIEKMCDSVRELERQRKQKEHEAERKKLDRDRALTVERINQDRKLRLKRMEEEREAELKRRQQEAEQIEEECRQELARVEEAHRRQAADWAADEDIEFSVSFED